MSPAGVWFTIGLLALLAVVGVLAAVYDRRRGREIEHDLGHPPVTKRTDDDEQPGNSSR